MEKKRSGCDAEKPGFVCRRLMSRQVTVIGIDGEESRCGLSVASLTLSADGRVAEVEVVPMCAKRPGLNSSHGLWSSTSGLALVAET